MTVTNKDNKPEYIYIRGARVLKKPETPPKQTEREAAWEKAANEVPNDHLPDSV